MNNPNPENSPKDGPVRLPDLPATTTNNEPNREDVIVINQHTLYYLLIGAAFFIAGFIVAWVTFSTTIGSTINTIRGDTAAAAREAVSTAVAGLPQGQGAVAVQPTATPVPRQAIDLGDSPAWGKADAKVTVVEFSDFQCPFCEQFYGSTYQLIKKNYSDKVRFVYKHFPLTSIHPYAMGAALAAECAREQGKFWEYHDQLFNNQSDLSDSALIQDATAVGITKIDDFKTCYSTKKYQDRITKDMNAGVGYSVGGTPTFFINGDFLEGAQPYQRFAQVLDAALAAATKG